MRMPLLLAALALVPAVAGAKPKQDAKAGAAKAPACGAKVLPLVVGNQWTYNSIAAPLPPPDAIKRLSPAQPKAISITVKSVEPKGGETVVTLEEKMTIDRTRDAKKPEVEEYTYESTITCTDKKFDISPNSFYFAGEPGGVIGLDVDKVDHLKGTSLSLTKGTIGEGEWREDLSMTWKRKPTEGSGAKLGSGKVELERRFTPQNPEPITTKSGMMYKAEKLGLITTGRVTLDNPGNPNAKPMELPANWVSQLWLADNVGVIQTLNSYGHMYQLVDTTVK
ncbi:MAG TPA: hypothetical protein VIV40_26630 [Kofleriaceae bacterium]